MPTSRASSGKQPDWADLDRAGDGRGPDEHGTEPGEEQPDFADEHGSTTFSDEMPGGPEDARDGDSPSGLAGAD